MSNPAQHHKINYIEFYTNDIERTKKFYSTVFGWSFTDWGPEYIDCTAADSGLAIGFAKGEPHDGPGKFAPMAVLYSSDLAATEAAIVAAGGRIVTPTFEFPGGRRFHFSDGAGNVLGVWSE
jgi:predicted enzyme related to lactoylglutathione lyase